MVGLACLFITYTVSPDDPLIVDNLLSGQNKSDRPDLAVRAYGMRVQQLQQDLIKDEIFGKVTALYSVTEFQKRGMPHLHMVVWLAQRPTADQWDEMIWAEIPDRETHPELHDLLIKLHVHRCSAEYCGRNPVTNQGECRFHFPMPFSAETLCYANDAQVCHRRRAPSDGGQQVILPSSGDRPARTVDNSMISTYNPFLTMRYRSHINVVPVTSLRVLSYLFDYMNKGPDRLRVQMEEGYRDCAEGAAAAVAAVAAAGQPVAAMPETEATTTTNTTTANTTTASTTTATATTTTTAATTSTTATTTATTTTTTNTATTTSTRRPVDEIAQYVDGRAISTHEAVFRLNGMSMFYCTHTIVRLAVHLPNRQPHADGRQVLSEEDVMEVYDEGMFEGQPDCSLHDSRADGMPDFADPGYNTTRLAEERLDALLEQALEDAAFVAALDDVDSATNRLREQAAADQAANDQGRVADGENDCPPCITACLAPTAEQSFLPWAADRTDYGDSTQPPLRIPTWVDSQGNCVYDTEPMDTRDDGPQPQPQPRLLAPHYRWQWVYQRQHPQDLHSHPMCLKHLQHLHHLRRPRPSSRRRNSAASAWHAQR